MTGTVTIHREGDIAVIALDHPPAQVMTPPLRAALAARLQEAEADGAVRGVVLGDPDGGFPGPVNPREFDAGLAHPTPAEIAALIEGMTTPVVALLSGQVAGAGAELALAARARIATDRARLGFADGLLGLPPSAGASQRLPRLLGPRHALTLLLSGRNYPVTSEVVRGLFHGIHSWAEAGGAALDLARSLAEAGVTATRCPSDDGMGDPALFQDEIARRRAAAAPGDAFARAVISCVEAAQLFPLGAGLDFEAATFEEVAASDRARALRHIAIAEARVSAGITAAPVRIAGLLTDGPEAAEVCARMARRGIGVIVYQPDAARAARFRERLRAILAGKAAVQSRSDMAGERAEDRVVIQTDRAALTTAEVLLDLSPDEPQAKARAMSALAGLPDSAAPVLSLTSHHDVAALAPDGARSRVIGLHMPDRSFPARIAELAIGAETDPAAEARARRLMVQLRRLPVRVAASGGLAGPAMFAALLEAADALVRFGVEPAQIDAAMRRYGFALGPYRMIGEMAEEVGAALAPRRGRNGGLSALIARAGLRIGTAADVEGEAAVLAGLTARARGGVTVSGEPWQDAEIQTALLAAMVNEGLRLLDRGAVARPLVLDVVMVQGYGFPRARGGPMQAADATGLFGMVQAMKALGPLDEALWAPQPKILELQRDGLCFADLDR